jgi:glycosyltransferase involved in cell wall biosynthesis
MKPLLTVGIPTYNRSDELNKRLNELGKLGYFNDPDVQIIIHDNDSIKKDHCLRVKDLQRYVSNLDLIESSPNIGMAKACYKIIAKAKGEWIILLGDDDPIIQRCSPLKSLIRKNKECDHLYFTPKTNEKGKTCRIQWMPKLKVGYYKTSFVCAKQGFTTGFAFLGAHCFRNKDNLAEIWIKCHMQCLFYGHCVMFLENYRKSFYTGKTVAAWTPGNERIPAQFNVLRHLELRNLFKYPPSKAIREFTHLNPFEVVKQGRFPLLNHIIHPEVKFINDYELLPKKRRITLKKVSTISFNPLNKILILGKKINDRANSSCIFINKFTAKKYHYNASIVFHVGPLVGTAEISRIIAKLQLLGPINLNDSEVSDISLVQGYCKPRKLLRIILDYSLLTYSIFLYGAEGLDRRKVIINYFTRPRKGLYAGINAIERGLRKMAQKILSRKSYYKTKKFVFGVKHFKRKKKLLISKVSQSEF